jgi:hypothetical protein
VDIIEAGFPIASPDDFAAVKAIAMDVGNAVQADGYVPVICGLSRTRDKDLETAWEAVRHAKLPRVHTFIATSGKDIASSWGATGGCRGGLFAAAGQCGLDPACSCSYAALQLKVYCKTVPQRST